MQLNTKKKGKSHSKNQAEDLNARWDIIKLLEKNIGRTLWHKLQQGVIDILSGVMKIKAKINKWDLIKLKSFAQHRKQ